MDSNKVRFEGPSKHAGGRKFPKGYKTRRRKKRKRARYARAKMRRQAGSRARG